MRYSGAGEQTKNKRVIIAIFTLKSYIMIKSRLVTIFLTVLFTFLMLSCQPPESRLKQETLASLGDKFKKEYIRAIEDLETKAAEEPTSIDALLGLAETNIILYIFGFSSREETLPAARAAFQKAWDLDSLDTNALRLSGILSLLDWEWEKSEAALQKAIEADPGNLNAHHWYSLYLSAMGKFDEAMAQSDTIMTMDPGGDYLIGRGSLYYFARRNEELRDLMIETIAQDTIVPWGYDWLGMAYCELKEFETSIDTYYTAFELSDGLAEVGGGLGHALGLGGQNEIAKQIADYYAEVAKNRYVPPVQRAFIHIGLGEYDEAIALLEQAYDENSWFIVFIQVEPWYDPIRGDKRFEEIMNRMNFPVIYRPSN